MEAYAMHILILASTPNATEKMQDTPDDAADRYTVVTTWPDAISSLEKDRPGLVLVERAAFARVELSTLSGLTEPGRWPPLLVVDTLAAGSQRGLMVARRLAQPQPQEYQVGELRIDTRKRRASLGERWVTLPPIQYRLLLVLAQREGEVIGCQELLRLVWGYESEETEARELVKVHIRQIRRRLGLDPEEHHYIHSVRGFGYMLALPDEA
jgi:DNA-binding winged helix-turn-helix (wHTH) protein